MDHIATTLLNVDLPGIARKVLASAIAVEQAVESHEGRHYILSRASQSRTERPQVEGVADTGRRHPRSRKARKSSERRGSSCRSTCGA